jgi:hypothetical protein
MLPRASCIVPRASCTRAVKYLPASSGRLPLPLDRRLVGFVRRRAACQCIGRRAAIPARSPRRGRRRDSVGGREGIRPPARHRCWGSRGLPSRSIPQPHHSGPVPRSGTVPRSVESSHGGTASHSGSVSRSGMVSLRMGSIVVAKSQGRTSDVERGSTGNGRCRERAMRDHGRPGSCPAAPTTNVDEHRDDDLVSGCACRGELRGCRGGGAPFGLDGLGNVAGENQKVRCGDALPTVARPSSRSACERERGVESSAQEDESWDRAMQRATIEITALGSARRGGANEHGTAAERRVFIS